MANGFQETPIERFITVSSDIFDLTVPIATLTVTYNSKLVDCIRRFKSIYEQLAARFPTLRVVYCYACKGETSAVLVPIKRKVEKLQGVLSQHFPKAKFEFRFLGADELVDLANRSPQATLTLCLAENPISSEDQVAFLCLVRLQDYHKFITDDNGQLRRGIFEANVRDYQGRTQVNDDIQKSLKAKGPEDFWWLNNGITVLAKKASQSGKKLTIENPEIVNGLQTSTEVFNHFSSPAGLDDARNLLVRVIVPDEDDSRDRIIKATNSQTPVQPASLRATDRIHRQIEEYLRPRGLFYDRRKNFYKNEGKPRDKIIGIPHMSQAVMAILLQRPDTARSRPSSLITS
jgi:hypothetical protein